MALIIYRSAFWFVRMYEKNHVEKSDHDLHKCSHFTSFFSQMTAIFSFVHGTYFPAPVNILTVVYRSFDLFVTIKFMSLLIDESRIFRSLTHASKQCRNEDAITHWHRRTSPNAYTLTEMHSNEQPVQNGRRNGIQIDWSFRMVFGSINEFCPISDGKSYMCINLGCFFYRCRLFLLFLFGFFVILLEQTNFLSFSFFSFFILTLDTRFYRSCGCNCCCFRRRRRRHHQPLTMFTYTDINHIHTCTLGKNFSNRKCFYFVEFVAASAATAASCVWWLCFFFCCWLSSQQSTLTQLQCVFSPSQRRIKHTKSKKIRKISFYRVDSFVVLRFAEKIQ